GANTKAVCAETVETVKNGPLGIGLLTPLLSAVPYGNYETVALLVNAGASVNAKDVRCMTPLAMAVSSDRPDPRIVRLLLAQGAKVDLTIETEQARMTASLVGALEQKLLQLVDPPPGVEGMEYSVLQMGAAGIPPGPEVDAIVSHIAAGQRREGDWPNYGTI